MRLSVGWVRRWFPLGVALVCLPVSGSVAAEVSAPAEEKAAPALSQLIQDYEQGEQLLAEKRAELKRTRTPQEQRRLEGSIRELELHQEERFKILEKWIGPLPPTVTPEKKIPLDRQVESQEQRHETVLETHVERRRP